MREIERKYLVSDDSFITQAVSSQRIARGLSRFEFESEIPLRCAEILLSRCSGTVEKIRHLVPYEGYTWEVDQFTGRNCGLVVAEVEMKSTAENPPLPEWVWIEVTSDFHYRNSYLAQRPYTEWFDK